MSAGTGMMYKGEYVCVKEKEPDTKTEDKEEDDGRQI